MFKHKINRLINDYGIKQEYIIDLIGSNRVTFPKKLKTNDFSPEEKTKIEEKYGSLMD
jgi:hypothetical protein